MNEKQLDPAFLIFAGPVVCREIMKSPNPAGKNEIAKMRELVLHAQNAFEERLNENDGEGEGEEFAELAEEFFLQGMREQSAITKDVIDSVIKKSFAVARALISSQA
jgi:hypothetical protein